MSLYRVMQMYCSDIDDVLHDLDGELLFDFVCELIQDNCGIDIDSYLGKIIILDYIIQNPDRHFNNIFLLCNSITGEFSVAPVLDNGMSLWGRCSGCKPFCDDFKSQLELTDEYLHIDIDSFKHDIENKRPEFKVDVFERAKKLLLYQLERTYGKLWIKC